MNSYQGTIHIKKGKVKGKGKLLVQFSKIFFGFRIGNLTLIFRMTHDIPAQGILNGFLSGRNTFSLYV